MLKGALEVVVAGRKRTLHRVRQAEAPATKAAGIASWLVLVDSKFLVFEVVDLVFPDRVGLSGFVPVPPSS